MDVFFATTWVELVWFDMAMAETDTLDKSDALCRDDGENFAGRAFVCSSHDFDHIIFADTLSHTRVPPVLG